MKKGGVDTHACQLIEKKALRIFPTETFLKQRPVAIFDKISVKCTLCGIFRVFFVNPSRLFFNALLLRGGGRGGGWSALAERIALGYTLFGRLQSFECHQCMSVGGALLITFPSSVRSQSSASFLACKSASSSSCPQNASRFANRFFSSLSLCFFRSSFCA